MVEETSRDEWDWPPEAIKPLWSEVIVFTGALLAYLALTSGLSRWENEAVFLVIFLNPLALPLITLPVFRGLLRIAVRRLMGLPKDPLPPWFKWFGVVFTPDYARQISPAWQIEDDRLHLPVIAHFGFSAISVVVAAFIFAALNPDAMGFLALFTVPAGVILGLPFLILCVLSVVTTAYRRGRLPKPGEDSSFPIAGWQYA